MPGRKLEAHGRAPGQARDFISEYLDDAPEELRLRACQVVSELVTNSVRHADGWITVEVSAGLLGSFDMNVRDTGPGFTAGPKAAGHADADGWGLLFVDMLTESWCAGGPGSPVVSAHFEPRSIYEHLALVDPLLDDRLRDLLDVRMLLDSIKDYAIFGLDHWGTITLWNAGGERLTGYSMDDVLGTSVNDLHGDSTVAAELPAALAHGRHEHERWIYRKDGSRFWADSVVTPILDSVGSLRGFSVIARDVTWRKQLDEDRDGLITRIKHMARSDDLTGLPNRRRWHEELDRELARSRRNSTSMCVAMVDLDAFKAYNDEHGHLAGDALLVETAAKWTDALRTTDMLARYGGDEFSVILPDCPVDEAIVVVDRMRLSTPRPVTCSAGIASSDGGEAAEAVVRRADSALYRVKRAKGPSRDTS